AELREDAGERLRIDAVDTPLPVVCDHALSMVAIRNLVQNALKYSPADQPVTLHVYSRSGRAKVEVQDHGAGIAAGEAARIFGKYYRSPGAGRVPGTGLGLFLARSIARSHGGDVELVRSGPEGSVFRFSLPLRDGPEVSSSDT
ncbi:MAG: ATP-binding protein, partial [Lysobacteraceae bacterium]